MDICFFYTSNTLLAINTYYPNKVHHQSTPSRPKHLRGNRISIPRHLTHPLSNPSCRFEYHSEYSPHQPQSAEFVIKQTPNNTTLPGSETSSHLLKSAAPSIKPYPKLRNPTPSYLVKLTATSPSPPHSLSQDKSNARHRPHPPPAQKPPGNQTGLCCLPACVF